MTESSKRFLLVYGSQTGQSKAISEEITERCDRLGIVADIHCFGRIEKEFVLENESLVVIVVSTTGDGDPPDTVSKFWRRIKRKTLLNTHFANMRYTLLGLGDSNYDNFCKCPNMVNDRLKELGASLFMDPGFADDAVGLEIAVEPWIDSLLETLCSMFGLPPPGLDNKAVNPIIQCNGDAPNSTPSVSDLTERVTSNLTLTSKASEVVVNGLVNTSGGEIVSPDVPPQPEEPTQPTPAGWFDSIPIVNCEELSLPITPASYIKLEYMRDSTLATEQVAVQNNAKLPFANSSVEEVKINNIRCLTAADSVKKTLCVELDCKDLTDYKSGDSFSIVSQNSESEVLWLLDRLNINEVDTPVRLSILPDTTKKKASVPEFVNNPSTLKDIFSTCLDIRHTPKKAFLRLLSSCCSSEEEKKKLLYLSSRQGAELYKELIVEGRRKLLDVLHAVPSCIPSVQSLIENLPRLLPRAYSVASAGGASTLRFAFNVMELPSVGGLTERKGLVTGRFDHIHCTGLPYSSKIKILLRTQQHFRLPTDSTLPLILIGPGTGVAPFIGFLADREKLLEAGAKLGECLLFFGNRHVQRDYLFREELSHHLNINTLTQLHVCFSRDDNQVSKTGAKYVTDLLRQQSRNVSRLIMQDSALIYVCGDAKNMSKDVHQAIMNILKTENGCTDDEVLTIVKGLRDEKRYKEDVWV